MANIFISYRRDDSSDAARTIYTWLKQHFPNSSLFMDVDSVPAGVDFRASVEKAVIQSSVMLVIIGAKWLEIADSDGVRRLENPDDFVRIEIEMAMRHKIVMIPLLVNNATMPPPQLLPSALAALSYSNAIHIRSGNSFKQDMERLALIPELTTSSFIPQTPYTTAPKKKTAFNPFGWFLPQWAQRTRYPWVTWISFLLLLVSLSLGAASILGIVSESIDTCNNYVAATAADAQGGNPDLSFADGCSTMTIFNEAFFNGSYFYQDSYSSTTYSYDYHYYRVGFIPLWGIGLIAFVLNFPIFIVGMGHARRMRKIGLSSLLFFSTLLLIITGIPSLVTFLFGLAGPKNYEKKVEAASSV